jgi:rubrerythrin
MPNLKGSKTEANLKAAYAGESQARGKYVYFAAKAREEGYTQVAQTFEEFAVNEQEHAKLWCKLLGGIGNTAENLKAAIDGEHAETTEMYPAFAKTAEEEGFADIATQFRQVAGIEKGHEAKFNKLASNLQKGGASGGAGVWKCTNCGHIVEAKNSPSTCPVCGNSDIAWSGFKAFAYVQD